MIAPLRIMTFLSIGSFLLLALGCASQTPDAHEVEMRTIPDPRARELDLVIPEDTQDVSKLDDAALASKIEALNRQVNELTKQTFEMALEPEGATNLAYRVKLQALKIAETRLGELEHEQIRRQKANR